MTQVETLYGPIDAELFERAKQIRLLVCDVDGVLSDGRIYMGNQGEELKTFHTKDGFGLKALREIGIEVGIITGRNSRIVSDRMAALGIDHVYQGQGDKLPALQDLLDLLGLDASQTAYIGDDV
ncbi:MAG: 3-deoxy-D-manno-octulosonate 8-phosphate phosphatase, partial [Aeromonadaceae bacterium]|nr:3-deoxy-D-manno-octulosonate 8-phosphate phosphatase [Aeromonadaceae bacterium]